MAKNQNKTKPTKVSVDDFLATVADERKRADSAVLIQMMEEITGEPATMWGPSIIGFGSYHYKYPTGREGDMIVAGFSPRKQAMTIYLMGGISRQADKLAQLGKHKTGKSCLYIKRLSDVDMDVLRDLVVTSVEQVKNNDIIY